MRLHKLINQFNAQLALTDLPDSEVTGIQEDSRQIRPGNVFIARGGTKTQGHQFVADAAGKGAIAVVTETDIPSSPLPQIKVPHAGAATSVLANLFYGQPSQQLKVIGITGTNGKTTITYLLRHLLAHVHKKCGIIGTVEIDDGKQAVEASMTTPSAGDVAEILGRMRDNGCDACAIETSSHALHQGRIAGVTFTGAGFTNLTGDHLDYHGTMDNYASAKAILFENLPASSVAVVNADDPAGDRMVRDTKARVIRFGIKNSADYRAQDIKITAQGTHFILVTPDGCCEVEMHLIGRHNVENALLAAALAGETFGLTAQQIASGLKDALGAPGRLQAVRAGQPFAVLVDYAHTDDALDNVLSALRPLAGGQLRVLFGCGGDRDRTKRPRMARTAQTYADSIYVTSDNPRTENADFILTEIATGFSADKAKSVYVDVDRRTAIRRVLADARPGDVVLIAGKGHENYQIIGTTKHHFDDVEEATRFLSQKGAAV
ncbi:MAG TPA: UDP-N-acetylmuramoyl-L-alanyl-D-glutamate--2,6-diaminopimelate ligase [Tepidisphaeraceae bacterium]|jgi:UDP-N-acetylmuramoyl-L-alanyl-D-glutamate--2,6-diaminopimelate ligase|nr:UDP-N-acetylmuramoyl-L-alanyl-D-glutamate--2,6-diaminopimelate ligase [Tepidisphaeraceae bacterium]